MFDIKDLLFFDYINFKFDIEKLLKKYFFTIDLKKYKINELDDYQ